MPNSTPSLLRALPFLQSLSFAQQQRHRQTRLQYQQRPNNWLKCPSNGVAIPVRYSLLDCKKNRQLDCVGSRRHAAATVILRKISKSNLYGYRCISNVSLTFSIAKLPFPLHMSSVRHRIRPPLCGMRHVQKPRVVRFEGCVIDGQLSSVDGAW
jgi:hypothetical protein